MSDIMKRKLDKVMKSGALAGEMTEADMNAGIDDLIAKGVLEIVGYENGEPMYQMTQKGKDEAQALVNRLYDGIKS